MTAKTVDVSHLIPDLRDLVHAALSLGWTGKQANNGKSVILRSHNGQKQLVVDPVRSMNDRMLRQKRSTVMRYADPMKLVALRAADETPDLVQGLSGLQAEVQVEAQLQAGGLPSEEAASAAVDSLLASRARQIDSGVTEVSRSAWQARRVSNPRGGKVYDSDAVIEIRWSDGSVTWECAQGCGYSSESNPRSVAAHYGKAHTMKGETPPAEGTRERVDPTYTEPLSHRDYTPTERLVRLLQHAIEEAMEGGWTTRDLAVAVLRWQHDRVGGDGASGIQTEPLSDAQIVERIRLLLDSGETVALERKVADLERLTAEMDEALLLAEQRAVKAEGTLRALAELASDSVVA